MVKTIVTLLIVAVAALAMTFSVGCESEAGNSALLGTAIGAGVGALAGGDTEGALVGAAIGGGVGYAAGNEADKKQTRQEIANVRAEQNTLMVWITNSNGSKLPVKLTRSGPNFIGPRGETYPTMPTEEQLKMVYGF